MRPFIAPALLPALALGAFAFGTPAFAQPVAQPADNAANPVGATGPQDTEKVKQVFVYGDDPCPTSSGSEIVVCARMPDNDRYRIPKTLRDNPDAPANQSWVNRARSIEYVGASGVNSCSPTGGGGFTGCFAKIAKEAKEERKTMLGSASWADAVAAARAKRLAKIDPDSERIEAEAKAREAEAAERAKQEAAARAQLEAKEAATGQPDSTNASTPSQ